MRDLKINRFTIPYNAFAIENYDAEVESGNSYVIKFKTTQKHGLKNGDTLVFTRNFGAFSVENELIVTLITDTEFSVSVPLVYLVDVENYALEGENGMLEFKNTTPYNCVRDVNNIVIYNMGKSITAYMLKSEDKYSGEDFGYEMIFCNAPLTNLSKKGSVFVENTWYFDENKQFDKSIKISEKGSCLTSTVGLVRDESYSITDSSYNSLSFLKEIKNDIIPDIIDNEKQQFVPMIKKGTKFKNVSEIVFNLHFRDRYNLDLNKKILNDKWNTTDEQLWNNLEIKNGSLSWKNNFENKHPEEHADELNDLGFTEDDIKFQKTKLKKTFLRLLFYSTNNYLSKELLCYSTIFLDANSLYVKYCNIKNQKNKSGSDIKVFDNTRIDENLRLSSSFSVKNRFDISKSSEGFYLYLFPDEISEEMANEKGERTIYMKVEFNHAGYGKTILMSVPRDDGDNGNALLPTDNNFPITYLKSVSGMTYTDIDKLNNDVMIPINLKYDKENKMYFYYFPWYERDGDKIIINLWEPRMRG